MPNTSLARRTAELLAKWRDVTAGRLVADTDPAWRADWQQRKDALLAEEGRQRPDDCCCPPGDTLAMCRRHGKEHTMTATRPLTCICQSEKTSPFCEAHDAPYTRTDAQCGCGQPAAFTIPTQAFGEIPYCGHPTADDDHATELTALADLAEEVRNLREELDWLREGDAMTDLQGIEAMSDELVDTVTELNTRLRTHIGAVATGCRTGLGGPTR